MSDDGRPHDRKLHPLLQNSFVRTSEDLSLLTELWDGPASLPSNEEVERWLGQQQSPGSHSLSPLPKPSSHGMPSTKPPAATATLRDSVDSSIAGVLPSIDLCEDWLPTDTEVESYLGRAPSLTQASSTPRPAAQSPQGPTEAAPVHTRVSVSQLTSSIPTKAAQQGTPTSSPLRYQHTGSVSPLQNSKHERSSQHSEARRPAQHKRATAPGQLRSAKSTGQHAVASAEHAAALQWRPSTGSLGVKHMAAPQIAVAEDANMLAEAALALSQQVDEHTCWAHTAAKLRQRRSLRNLGSFTDAQTPEGASAAGS